MNVHGCAAYDAPTTGFATCISVSRWRRPQRTLTGATVVYCSANLFGDRVQRMKYMYRKLAGGGVFKRRMRAQRVLDEF